jgi:hypothetical protein
MPDTVTDFLRANGWIPHWAVSSLWMITCLVVLRLSLSDRFGPHRVWIVVALAGLGFALETAVGPAVERPPRGPGRGDPRLFRQTTERVLLPKNWSRCDLCCAGWLSSPAVSRNQPTAGP